MSNTLKVIDMITRESLRIAHEKLTFIGTINRSYDSSFAKTGAKSGDTLRIRLPNQYTRRKGSRVMDVQDQDEAVVSLTVATQDGVDMKFNSAELALSIDELSERYIEPAVSVLCSGIEGDVLTALTKDIANFSGTTNEIVGATDLDAVAQARAKLNRNLAPKDKNRSFQLDSITMAAVSNGISTGANALFNPQADISKVFLEGYLGRNNGVNWYENDRTYLHTAGADVAGTVNETTAADGDTTLTVSSHTSAVGDTFTIAAVYDVHPETKAAYAELKQFVVTASGTTTLTFLPAFQSTGAKQNISALPLTSAVVTTYSANSRIYQSNIMYHKDAFAFVTADLPIMDDAIRCVRRVKDGLSIRCWQGSDIRNDELLLRLDILYGYKTIRAPWACRVNN